MDWKWMFFSFRGRLGAERFERVLSNLIWVCFLPGTFSLLWRPDPPPDTFYMIIHLALLACFLAAIWPVLALAIKRLNDSERSVLLAIPAALALPLGEALVVAGDCGVIGPPPSYVAKGIALLLLGVFALLEVKIAAFRGTTGPNRFGPEPID